MRARRPTLSTRRRPLLTNWKLIQGGHTAIPLPGLGAHDTDGVAGTAEEEGGGGVRRSVPRPLQAPSSTHAKHLKRISRMYIKSYTKLANPAIISALGIMRKGRYPGRAGKGIFLSKRKAAAPCLHKCLPRPHPHPMLSSLQWGRRKRKWTPPEKSRVSPNSALL